MNKKISLEIDKFIDEKIQNERLETVVSDRFSAYSKYVIQERALPDVRDGLKPVQRRILFGMFKMGVTHNKPYKKSARIVGDVMGKYHPHGDSSIYEAMVRLSQYWKTNMLLVDMHGNNGSHDGDGAAAMRYTEARMSKISEELLRDINKNTVDFIPNFDDEEYEPVVLPSRYPNILVNGSTGISSGYATDIPPHNLSEVIDGTIHRINNPTCNLNDILGFIKGPDFPTGGIIHGEEGIIQAYETGKGKITLRAKMDILENQIIVTEIPYEVNKANLVKKIDELRVNKKIPGVTEVRDESDKDGLRIAIDFRKSADINLILNIIYKYSDLQKNYSLNMVAINNKRPVQMSLISILDAYITHQKDVVTNRSNYDLERAKKRLHILDGLIRMVDIIEEVIKTIRESNNKAESKINIQNKFGFTEEQAEAIVMLQLYRLSNTDITALVKEKTDLTKESAKLKMILSSDIELKKVIVDELTQIKDKLGEDRKTSIEEEIESKIAESELVSEEETFISISYEGYVKRTSKKSYNSNGEHQCGVKDGDVINTVYQATTLNTLLFFTSKGNYIYLPVYRLPEKKWKEMGNHISNIVMIDHDEKIVGTFLVDDFELDIDVLITTKNSLLKKTKLKEFEVQRYNKKLRAIKLRDEDKVVSVDFGTENDYIVVVSESGYAIKYEAKDVNPIGLNAFGIMSINLRNPDVDSVAFAYFMHKDCEIMMLTNRGNVIRFDISNLELLTRNRRPSRITLWLKTNPHLLISGIRISKHEYKNDIPLYLLGDKGILKVNAFSIKHSKSDNGKHYLTEKYGNAIDIIKIQRNRNLVAERIVEDTSDAIDLDNFFENPDD